MMAYVTINDMVQRFGEVEMIQLTDRDAATGAVDVAVLDAVIADAQAEVDSYLSVRYALPLAVVPDILRSYTADVARYRLYDTEIPEIVKKRYDDALRFLRDVSARRASLDKDVNGVEAPVANGVKISAPARVFNGANLEGF